jgi:cell division septation protein DedD
LSHDTAQLNDDAFHEIQLSGKQLVFLFMATTVVSVFIFLCGVLVGRGVHAAKAPETAEQASAGAPLAEAAPPAQAGPVASEPPPPAEAPASEDLSYHDRLQGDGATKEQLKPAAEPQPTPSERAARPAPAAAAAAAPQTAQNGWVVQLIVLRNRGEATTIVQRLTSKGYPAFVVEPVPGAAVRAFKVQVGRYSDRREAEQAARRLEKEEQFKPWILR